MTNAGGRLVGLVAAAGGAFALGVVVGVILG